MYRKAKAHFKKADPILYEAARRHRIDDIVPSRDLFGDLVFAIVNQQLSSKAAMTIYARLEGKLKGKAGAKRISPDAILKLPLRSLRSAGLSGAKAAALKSLAAAAATGALDLAVLRAHPDDMVIEILTSVKGIGPWTAEMILMHSLGREDVFSKGDLGLRKGIMRLYGLKAMPSDRVMDRLAARWSPYRTYAAKVIWRVADEKKR
ncbi:MAG: DNA-3-methyladenine glycosylase 2 family protein [Patescibacteria group bacterium]|nr:DNA-3-methyladenine glycosylase 2 family protein [Patescibacteria group bacterium]